MNSAISTSNNDAAFFRDRKAMLVYPGIILPFAIALFWILGGGKGNRYLAEEVAENKPGASGFNASMPNAKNGAINGPDVEKPGYGKAAAGQVLSSFTHTRQDSATRGLKALPAIEQTHQSSASHASSLATGSSVAKVTPTSYQHTSYSRSVRSKPASSRPTPGYYYNAPKGSSSVSDQQLASQLRTYENTRSANAGQTSANQAAGESIPTGSVDENVRRATVLVSDNLTATRLSEPTNAEDAFYTAPTAGSRRQAERAVLSGGNSYGSKKTVAWMIPVVVHEDQTFKSGNTVKLRLTKEITADGITIPANTILHAVCQTGDDRLRMVVRSLQLNGQLISLDLEVYDIDGLAGVNMPGLSNHAGGQMRSSAIQGVQLPGVGGLANSVVNQARMQASQATNQTTVRLKAGYNLYLKAR